MQQPNFSYNLKFFLSLVIIAELVFISLGHLPSYTVLSLTFLLLPSLFFIFRKHEHIDRRKFTAILLLGVAAGILWDRIAITYQIWGFPEESISGWFLGIPLEEYLFALFFCAVTLGIYTSLPRFVQPKLLEPFKIRTIPITFIFLLLETGALSLIFFTNIDSYFKWLLILAIIPSFFFIARKGEKIDFIRLTITCLIMSTLVILIIDGVFIPAKTWIYYDQALIGRFGFIPIDDVLFAFFNTIVVVGFYTSLPHKHPITGNWNEK